MKQDACQPYVFQCPPLDISTPGVGGGELGPQVNKFEQVYNDDHQMSVAGGGVGPRSDIHRAVPYHVSYPMMRVM